MMILLPLAHLTALYGYGLIMVGNPLLNTNLRHTVAEWLGHRTWNPVIPCSSPALTTCWVFFSVSPCFNSSTALVHHQLVCLLPVEVLNLLSLFRWPREAPEKPQRGEVNALHNVTSRKLCFNTKTHFPGSCYAPSFREIRSSLTDNVVYILFRLQTKPLFQVI